MTSGGPALTTFETTAEAGRYRNRFRDGNHISTNGVVISQLEITPFAVVISSPSAGNIPGVVESTDDRQLEEAPRYYIVSTRRIRTPSR